MTWRDRNETFLRFYLLTPLPSCAVLVQLVILASPYMITSVQATPCMRGLSRTYNAGKTYSQARLGKTLEHYPLAGGYINLPTALPKSSDHSRILLVKQQPQPMVRNICGCLSRQRPLGQRGAYKAHSTYGVFIGPHRLIMLVPFSGTLVMSTTVCNIAPRKTRFLMSLLL